MSRNLMVTLAVVVGLFVLGVAVWTRNVGLYILAAVCAGAAITAWTRSGPR